MAQAERIVSDRQRFLEGAHSPPGVRRDIVDSWRRSLLSGVPADRVPLVPIEDLSDRDSRLLRAARPVLDRLADELADTVTSIILTDPQARILSRWVGERGLQASLDRVLAVPGACYGEDVVGTNGLGTVIECRRPTVVAGSEHFHEMLQSLTCVGTPLIHPVTGRLEGVLDLTCRYEDTNQLMLPIVLEAARQITGCLRDTSSTAERLLLDRFLAATRRSLSAVIALNRDVMITNAAAGRLLEPADHSMVWGAAERAIDGGYSSQEIPLSAGMTASANIRPIRHGHEVVGAVVELEPAGVEGPRRSTSTRADTGLPGLVGRSPEWRHLCAAIREYAGAEVDLAVLGDAGTGKLRVAQAAHRLRAAGTDPVVLDAAVLQIEGVQCWLCRLQAAVNEPSWVILRHVDLLPVEVASAAASLLEAAPGGCRILATAGADWPETAPRALVDRFPLRITVPSLARRTADIPPLLNVISERYGAADLRWTTAVVQLLGQCSWPGNVRQLESLAKVVIGRRRTGDVTVGDLPIEYRSAAGQLVLTALERIERDAIVRALAESGGNKNDAATALGISRSTLYRKLAAYGIELDHRG